LIPQATRSLLPYQNGTHARPAIKAQNISLSVVSFQPGIRRGPVGGFEVTSVETGTLVWRI
jgi:hypothetical protein